MGSGSERLGSSFARAPWCMPPEANDEILPPVQAHVRQRGGCQGAARQGCGEGVSSQGDERSVLMRPPRLRLRESP